MHPQSMRMPGALPPGAAAAAAATPRRSVAAAAAPQQRAASGTPRRAADVVVLGNSLQVRGRLDGSASCHALQGPSCSGASACQPTLPACTPSVCLRARHMRQPTCWLSVACAQCWWSMQPPRWRRSPAPAPGALTCSCTCLPPRRTSSSAPGGWHARQGLRRARSPSAAAAIATARALCSGCR